SSQVTAVTHELKGSPLEKWPTAAMTPAPAGIGMPTKYFLPGRPGFDGCGFFAMLKRAKRLAPAIRNAKLAMDPRSFILRRRSGEIESGNKWKPHIQASSAGATPKVITSANESSSRPK